MMKHGHSTASTTGYLCAGVIVLACVLAAPQVSYAGASWSVGVSGGEDGIEDFCLSVGEYYRVPRTEVMTVHRRGICCEDLPVVFFIAGRARVHPNSVVLLRLNGMSWMDISLRFGLRPDVYYVPVRSPHPGRCRDYACYRHGPQSWSTLRLSDRDIVNQVNLRFISERHGYAPEKIVEYRSGGRGFMEIHRHVRLEKNRGPEKRRETPRDFRQPDRRPSGPGHASIDRGAPPKSKKLEDTGQVRGPGDKDRSAVQGKNGHPYAAAGRPGYRSGGDPDRLGKRDGLRPHDRGTARDRGAHRENG